MNFEVEISTRLTNNIIIKNAAGYDPRAIHHIDTNR